MGRTAVDSARSMVTGAADPAFLVDMDGKILAWNSAATELFGVAAWQASSHSCFKLMCSLRCDGEPACRADCPVLARIAVGSVPAATEVNLEPTSAPLLVHHLAIWDERNRPVAVLHLIGRVGGERQPSARAWRAR